MRQAPVDRPPVPETVPAQLILAVNDAGEPLSGAGGSPRGDYRRMAGYAGSARAAATAESLASEYGLTERAAWTIAPLNLRCMLFTIAPGDDLAQVIQRLQQDGRVALVQPLHEFETLATTAAMPNGAGTAAASGASARVEGQGGNAPPSPSPPLAPSPAAPPPYNDPYFPLQRGFQQMAVPPLQQVSVGARVKLAVIDTGVDARHPDLQGQVPRQRDYVSGNGAYVDTFPERHGTEVMGLIAARANNRIGIVGTAPGVQVLSYRACWSDTARRADTGPAVGQGAGQGVGMSAARGASVPSNAAASANMAAAPVAGAARCNSFTLAQALGAAIADGADVINLSLGGPSDPLLTRLVTYAQSRGAVVVAASPPQRLGIGFPSNVPGTLVVASAEDVPRGASAPASVGAASVATASPASDAPGSSAEAASVDLMLAAPGRGVLTTIPGGDYDMESGSSMACAQVAGVVALLRSLMPSADAARLRRALRDSMSASTGSINACHAARHLGVPGLHCS